LPDTPFDDNVNTVNLLLKLFMDNVTGTSSPIAAKLPQSDDFYADDLNAQVIAENNQNPDNLKEDEDLPVTTGEISIGDLDEEPVEEVGTSDDEENMAGGEDNVVSSDDTDVEEPTDTEVVSDEALSDEVGGGLE
jgi:hypothetical protein